MLNVKDTKPQHICRGNFVLITFALFSAQTVAIIQKDFGWASQQRTELQTSSSTAQCEVRVSSTNWTLRSSVNVSTCARVYWLQLCWNLLIDLVLTCCKIQTRTQCRQRKGKPTFILWVHISETAAATAVSSSTPPSVHFAAFWVALCWSSGSLVAMVGEGWHQLWFTGCTEQERDKISDLRDIRGDKLQLIHNQNGFTYAEVSPWSRNSPNNLWQKLWVRKIDKNQP